MEIFKVVCSLCTDKKCLINGQTDGSKCPKLILYNEAKEIQAFLEEKVPDDPSFLVERLSVINSYMARTGYLLAQATQLQDEAVANVFLQKGAELQSYPATIQKSLISSYTSDVNSLVKLLERQNRALVHHGENIRTQISFAKQDLALQRQGY